MNLKESYQYQNHILTLFQEAYSNLSSELYVTRVVRSHYRSRAADGAEDEVVDETMDRPFGAVPVDAVVAFALALIDERTNLGAAITDAKYRAKMDIFGQNGIDLDAELSANKLRHQLEGRLEKLASIKPEVVRKSTAKDFRFNAEGNQTPYFYPVEDVITIDFDRERLRMSLKRLKETSTERSMAAEKTMLNCDVQFMPRFDMNDSYMDTLTAFAEENGYMNNEPSV